MVRKNVKCGTVNKDQIWNMKGVLFTWHGLKRAHGGTENRDTSNQSVK